MKKREKIIDNSTGSMDNEWKTVKLTVRNCVACGQAQITRSPSSNYVAVAVRHESAAMERSCEAPRRRFPISHLSAFYNFEFVHFPLTPSLTPLP